MKTACKLYQSLKCMLGNFEIQRNKTMHNKKPTLAHFIIFFFFFKLPIVKLNCKNRCCIFWKTVTVFVCLFVSSAGVYMLGRISAQKQLAAVEQAAQGGGGITILGGVQGTWRCGSKGHG